MHKSESDIAAIRQLTDLWKAATARGDIATVAKLMADDVVFLQPGQPEIRGKTAFMALHDGFPKDMKIEVGGDIMEIQVFGDFAYMWQHLAVKVTQNGQEVAKRSGPVLSLFRKLPQTGWALFRDANMLTADK